MKVPAINFNILNGYRTKPLTVNSSSESANFDNSRKVEDLSAMPYVYPISFGIANSAKLRLLFSYGLPCMYTGVTMIDPKVLARLEKNATFNKPAEEVLPVFDRYSDTISGMEAKTIALLKERASMHPNQNIKQLLMEVEPYYRRDLRKNQASIFRELADEFQTLPVEYQENFNLLMIETDKRLNERPMLIPFSSYEFKYKLTKIRDQLANGATAKERKVLNKLIKESKRLSGTTNKDTIDNQKKVIRFLDQILRKSVLKDNADLKELFETAKSRLFQEEIIAPFSRKSYIYDLARIIETLPAEKQEQIIDIAEKLPTSQTNFSAYIVKITGDTPSKIGHRLLWPYLASIEHIHPRSEQGADIMANFGGATTRANSGRKSIPFKDWIELHPDARKNCQKYLDRLIELYHEGVFEKNNIDPKYITDFAQTVYKESEGTLSLSLEKLYEL